MPRKTPFNNQYRQKQASRSVGKKTLPSSTQLFLRRRDVAARYSVSPSTVSRWVEQDILPEPLAIGGSVRWALAELEAYETRLEEGFDAFDDDFSF